jgi:hypothetical protein
MKKLTRTVAIRVGPRPQSVPERPGGIPIRREWTAAPSRYRSDRDVSCPSPEPDTNWRALLSQSALNGTA